MPTESAVSIRRARLWRAAGWVLLAAVVGLAVANIADWLSYREALRVPERVTAADWAAMFVKAGELAKGKSGTIDGRDLPAEFALLRAKDADFSALDARVRLWGRGALVVNVDFRLGPDWEKISHHVSLLPHRSSTVWSADPSLPEKLEPDGRMLTVIVGSHHEPLREWIVLPSEIRIVRRDSPDRVLRSHRSQSFPLARPDRVKIGMAVNAIPAGLRGHLHTSNALEGIYLRVNFERDGRQGREDIELANTWCEELDDLVDALCAAVPAEQALDLKSRVARSRAVGPIERVSVPWFDFAYGDLGPLDFPWWCVWPRWRRLVLDN